jgi:hypothetical protein
MRARILFISAGVKRPKMMVVRLSLCVFRHISGRHRSIVFDDFEINYAVEISLQYFDLKIHSRAPPCFLSS